MSAERDLRDVFVGGVATVDDVKDIFRDAFALDEAQMLSEGDPLEDVLAALGRGSMVTIYPLDPRGDFPFKVDVQFARRIDDAEFADVARRRRVRIAYAVDEVAQYSDYFVATEVGVSVRKLSFDDVDDETYICSLA